MTSTWGAIETTSDDTRVCLARVTAKSWFDARAQLSNRLAREPDTLTVALVEAEPTLEPKPKKKTRKQKHERRVP